MNEVKGVFAMSEDTIENQESIYQLMARAMIEVSSVSKDEKNPQHHYKFRGIDAVVNAAGPAFRKLGIIGPVPHAVTAGYRDVTTSGGKDSREATVVVDYRFYGPAGDYLTAQVPGEAMDVGDKGTAKAMSVAERIALLQVLCIPTGEPDPDMQSYERSAPPVVLPQPQPDPGPFAVAAVEQANPAQRDWAAEAARTTNLGDLVTIGQQCTEAGEFSGAIKAALMTRYRDLERAQGVVQ